MVVPAGPSFNLSVPLNVVMGTIPLQNYEMVFSQSAYTPASNYPQGNEYAQNPDSVNMPVPMAPPQPKDLRPTPSARMYPIIQMTN